MNEKLKSIWNKKASTIDEIVVEDCRIASIGRQREYMGNMVVDITIKLDNGEVQKITTAPNPNLKVGPAILTVTFWNKESKFGTKPSKSISNLL
jgi:hypothetical protein